ncbi:MAG: YdcF family protein [Candidatus Aquicultor sp.]
MHKEYKWGWYVVLAATVILYLLSTEPIANLLVYPLEKQSANFSPKDIQNADVIVILAGGVSSADGFRTHPQPVAWSRMTAGIGYFKQSKATCLVLSGGGGDPGESEADAMRYWARALGVSPEEIILETHSKNTEQEAIGVKKLLPNKPEPAIGLVTSGLHMCRAQYIFKKHFKQVIPLPSDFSYNPFRFGLRSLIPSSYALVKSTESMHEIVGLLWYKIQG